MLDPLETIIRRRKLLGLTQAKLASIAGVSQSLIAKIESSKIDPSYSNVIKILEALDKMEKKEKVKAGDIMTKDVVWAKKNEKLANIIEKMRKKNVSQLPVISEGKCVGAVTEKMILDMMRSNMDIDPRKVSVEEVMGECFPHVDEETPFELLSAILKHNQAILVTKKGKIVGIVSATDLFKTLT